MIAYCLVFIEFKLFRIVIKRAKKWAVRGFKGFNNWLWQEVETTSWQHEKQSHKRFIRFIFWKRNVNIIFGYEIVDICQQGCIVIGVEPSPGRNSNKIISCIELQSFHICLDDFFVLIVLINVFDIEPTQIIVIFPSDNFRINYLKIFNLISCILCFIFNSFSSALFQRSSRLL